MDREIEAAAVATRCTAHLSDVLAEIVASTRKFGAQHHLPMNGHLLHDTEVGWVEVGGGLEAVARRRLAESPCWMSIFAEEAGELLQATTPEEIRNEAIQVIAVALKMLDALDMGVTTCTAQGEAGDAVRYTQGLTPTNRLRLAMAFQILDPPGGLVNLGIAQALMNQDDNRQPWRDEFIGWEATYMGEIDDGK